MTVTEQEFTAVAGAAVMIFEQGNREMAFTLDDLARKMNRELTNRATSSLRKHGPGVGSRANAHRIDSPLEVAGLREKK